MRNSLALKKVKLWDYEARGPTPLSVPLWLWGGGAVRRGSKQAGRQTGEVPFSEAGPHSNPAAATAVRPDELL